MSLRERIDYRIGLLAVSALLVLVPAFDMWQDVAVEGKGVLSTVLENSVVVALTLLLVSLTVWLCGTDWESQYVQLVARWTTLGTVAIALVYGWILGFQLLVQGDLKPYIIAADGVVIGGIVIFIAGVYNVRSRRESAARAVERDRAAALFENTSDAVAAVEFSDGTAVVTETNEPFERVFAPDGESLVGRPAVAGLSAATNAASDSRTGESDVERVESVVGDPSARAELRVDVRGDERDFIVTYVPVDDGPMGGGSAGFLIFTDITAQKDRERQFERLSTGTEELLDTRSIDEMLDTVRALAADLFENATVGVWAYDDETGTYRPRGGGDETSSEDGLPVLTASPRTESDGGSDRGDAVASLDRDDLGRAFTDREGTAGTALVRRLTDSHLLIVVREREGDATTEEHLLDLLAADTRAVTERIDREDQLARRNDQLEFVNSLLRHDVQNSMTIIRARGEALADACDGTEGDYARTIVNQSDDVIALIDRFRALLTALAEDDSDLSPVAVAPLVHDRVEAARSAHPEATVTADVPDGLSALADETLENVVGNLIGNAIEHNDADSPTVEVSATETEDAVVLRVADDGPGIPDEQKEVVFRRGNRGLKEADIGSGFGLFFVDTLVDGYGGSVTVEDNDPRGAVFAVTLSKPAVEPDDRGR